MAQPVFTPQEMPAALGSRRFARTIVIGGVVLAAVLLSGAVVLWLHYGTAVFFEMVVSGIAACL